MSDLLADIQQDSISLDEVMRKLDEVGKDTPTESPTEKNQTEEAPSSQGAAEEQKADPNIESDTNVPFNKHPRWKQMQEERDQLRRQVEDLEASARSVAERLPAPVEGIEDIPTWFQMAVSNDVNIWKEYKKHSSVEREELKRELFQEQQNVKQREVQESQRWSKYVDDSLAKVQDKYNVDFSTEQGKNTQKEFVDFMMKRRPTDAQGSYDFNNGWEWFSELKQKTPDRSEGKKKVAAMSDSSGSSERAGRESVTREDLRGRGWRDFI